MSLRKREETQEMLRGGRNMRTLFSRQALLCLAGSILSGLLLTSCFSPLEWHAAAWVALVPILLVSRYSSPKAAFKWGLVCGLVFWVLGLSWLTSLADKAVPWPVTILLWLSLAAYCALYVAAFTMTVSYWFSAWGTHDWRKNVVITVFLPVLWIGFEYVRSNFATGFPWNTLGVSQALGRNEYSAAVCQLAPLASIAVAVSADAFLLRQRFLSGGAEVARSPGVRAGAALRIEVALPWIH